MCNLFLVEGVMSQAKNVRIGLFMTQEKGDTLYDATDIHD